MKRIFLTGGAGFIGSHLADRLLAAGHEVVLVDNLSTGRREQVPAGALFHPLDIKDPETFDLMVRWRPQALVHLAAQMNVRASVADPLFDARENILGSLNLFEAAARAGVEQIVFSSTGGALHGDGVPLPTRESDPTRPESPYGIAKLTVEHYLYYYQRQYGLTPVCLRYANVFGPRQNGLGEAGVVAIFLEKFLAGEQPIINGDGRQTRDFVYVADVVAATMLAVDYPAPGVFNVGTGQETDILTIYRLLQDLTGSPLGPVHGPAKPGEQRRSALNNSLAQEQLGWRPRVGLEEGLAATVQAFKESHALALGSP